MSWLRDLHFGWANGERPLIVFLAILVVGVTGWAVALGFLILDEAEPDNLRYISPQQIIGLDIAFVGGSITFVGEKCNDDDESHRVIGDTQWRSLDNLGLSPIPSFRGTRTYPPNECQTDEFTNRIPQTLTPGLWRLEGTEIDIDTGEVETWFTETFEVLGE